MNFLKGVGLALAFCILNAGYAVVDPSGNNPSCPPGFACAAGGNNPNPNNSENDQQQRRDIQDQAQRMGIKMKRKHVDKAMQEADRQGRYWSRQSESWSSFCRNSAHRPALQIHKTGKKQSIFGTINSVVGGAMMATNCPPPGNIALCALGGLRVYSGSKLKSEGKSNKKLAQKVGGMGEDDLQRQARCAICNVSNPPFICPFVPDDCDIDDTPQECCRKLPSDRKPEKCNECGNSCPPSPEWCCESLPAPPPEPGGEECPMPHRECCPVEEKGESLKCTCRVIAETPNAEMSYQECLKICRWEDPDNPVCKVGSGSDGDNNDDTGPKLTNELCEQCKIDPDGRITFLPDGPTIDPTDGPEELRRKLGKDEVNRALEKMKAMQRKYQTASPPSGGASSSSSSSPSSSLTSGSEEDDILGEDEGSGSSLTGGGGSSRGRGGSAGSNPADDFFKQYQNAMKKNKGGLRNLATKPLGKDRIGSSHENIFEMVSKSYRNRQ